MIKLQCQKLCCDSVWLMFDRWQYIQPTILLSFSEKEKLGKPKEESRNQYGFACVKSQTLQIHWYDFIYVDSYNLQTYWYDFICVNPYNLRIHIIRIMFSSIVHKGYFHGHATLPLHGKTCSAIDEQTENGSRKTPPTTHLNVRWRKRIRGKN